MQIAVAALFQVGIAANALVHYRLPRIHQEVDNCVFNSPPSTHKHEDDLESCTLQSKPFSKLELPPPWFTIPTAVLQPGFAGFFEKSISVSSIVSTYLYKYFAFLLAIYIYKTRRRPRVAHIAVAALFQADITPSVVHDCLLSSCSQGLLDSYLHPPLTSTMTISSRADRSRNPFPS